MRQVKLILVQSNQKKLMVGDIVQHKTTLEIKEWKDGDVFAIGNNWKKFWQPLKPYLTSEETILPNDLTLMKINNKWIEAYPDDLMGGDIEDVKKVIATPDKIGYVDMTDDKRGSMISCSYGPITFKQIKSILDNEGKCWLAEEEINNKVVINLTND